MQLFPRAQTLHDIAGRNSILFVVKLELCTADGLYNRRAHSSRTHHNRLPGAPHEVDLAVAPGRVDDDRSGKSVGVVAVRRELLSSLQYYDLGRHLGAHRSC
jgi:hypothetical protein